MAIPRPSSRSEPPVISAEDATALAAQKVSDPEVPVRFAGLFAVQEPYDRRAAKVGAGLWPHRRKVELALGWMVFSASDHTAFARPNASGEAHAYVGALSRFDWSRKTKVP